MNIELEEKQMLIQELAELKQQHRELDLAIQDLALRLDSNQLEIGRLKKQKLKLKDSIERLASSMIPNLLA
jgi:hypothetical protein